MSLTLLDTVAVPNFLRSDWVPRALGVIVFFFAWFLLATIFPNELMPYPLETFQIAIGLITSGEATRHVYWTLLRTIGGFGGSLILGIGIGIIMGGNDLGRRLFSPHVLVGLTVPALVWGAVWTLILGFNNITVLLATVIVVFPFITIPVWKAVEGIDRELVDMARAFNIPRTRLVRRLLIPSIFPALASVSRYALAISFHIVTIGEMLATNNGIGEMIVYSYSLFYYEQSWAWALIFMSLILIIEYGLLKRLEARAFVYRDDVDFQVIR